MAVVPRADVVTIAPPGPFFTTTTRGARIIYLEGYRFSRHRESGVKTRWYCTTHHSRGCPAVIFTIDHDKIIKCNNTHNHA
ncbi:unnamed protein product, partial [Iphiclides podalirius]